jgi:RNA polymerase sigma-70 factor (ECF subfamily)
MKTSSVIEHWSEFHGGGTAVANALTPSGSAAGDDHLFVVEAKLGSARAFGALYDRHKSEIYRSVFRMPRNQPDAENAVQRSFQSAFTNLGRFREDSSISTWMTRIALQNRSCTHGR